MDLDRLLTVFAEGITDAVSDVYLGHPCPPRPAYVLQSVERMRARLLPTADTDAEPV